MKKLFLLTLSTFLFGQSFASSISEEENVGQPKVLTHSEGEKINDYDREEKEETNLSNPSKTASFNEIDYLDLDFGFPDKSRRERYLFRDLTESSKIQPLIRAKYQF